MSYALLDFRCGKIQSDSHCSTNLRRHSSATRSASPVIEIGAAGAGGCERRPWQIGLQGTIRSLCKKDATAEAAKCAKQEKGKAGHRKPLLRCPSIYMYSCRDYLQAACIYRPPIDEPKWRRPRSFSGCVPCRSCSLRNIQPADGRICFSLPVRRTSQQSRFA